MDLLASLDRLLFFIGIELMRSVRRLNPYTSMCVIVLCGDSKIDDKYSSSSAHDYKWKLINASREVVNDLLDLILFFSFLFSFFFFS